MTSESTDKSAADATEGFMSRWSRRKRQGEHLEEQQEDTPSTLTDIDTADARLDDQPETVDLEAATEAGAGVDTGDDAEEELLTDEDMPAIETITSKSDVSMFFNRGVSRELRKAALKHLFSLPALNITDGLNDYDEDYTTFEPLGDIVTSDMRWQAERKARLAEEEEARQLAEAQAADAEAENSDSEDPDAELVAEQESQDEHGQQEQALDEQTLGEQTRGEQTPGEQTKVKEAADALTEHERLDHQAEAEDDIDSPLQDRTTV